MRTMKFVWVAILCLTCSCSSVFTVKSDPLQADVMFKDPKSGEKKSLGKTPLSLPTQDVRAAVGEGISSGEFFTVSVEKDGFVSQTFSIPTTKFGTLVTELDVKLAKGTDVEEQRTASDVLSRLFLAQKLALAQQYERAQIEIDKILVTFPKFARAYTMRASIYMAQKNYPESVKWYEEAIKIDPQMHEAVKMLARARTLQSGGREPANVPIPRPKGGQ